MTRRVGLVVNPASNGGRAAGVAGPVLQRLRVHGLDPQDLSAPTAQEAAQRATAAVAAGRIDALVVVGGDGVVHLGVNAVAQTPVALGVVAAGSGNDVARAAGLPVADPTAAVDRLVATLATRGRPVDAVRWRGAVRDGWYMAVLAAGFDALVNERANRWRWPRGRLRYTAAIVRELPVFRPRPYRLLLDGEPLQTAATLVCVANTPSYGGGLRVAPDARVDDALLDVVVLGQVGRRSLVRLYPKVFSGAHLGHPAVTVFRARRVEVDAPGVVAYADGERLAPLPLVCEVVPGAVRLLGAG